MLNELGGEAFILLPGTGDAMTRSAGEIINLFHIPGDRIINSQAGNGLWDLIIIDKRSTTIVEYNILSSCGPVIGLDEGGEAREFLPYLIDTFPKPAGRSGSNFFSSGFLSLPERRGEFSGRCDNVLISFGGEDPAGLTTIMAGFLVKNGFFPANRITAVKGPAFSSLFLPEGVAVIDSPKALVDIMPDYDLLFTSFGLTPYEAAACGVPVILLNPGMYHRKLSRIAGFPEIGVKRPRGRQLRGLLKNREMLISSARSVISGNHLSLSSFVLGLKGTTVQGCPVCGKIINPAVLRFPERSFFKCGDCGLVYQKIFKHKGFGYGREYFFKEYRDKYGKTYLEDFLNIRSLAVKRLGWIKGILKDPRNMRLADIGCAYGPFLSGAAEYGFTPFGVDISAEAVSHVMMELGFPAVCCRFEEFDLTKEFSVDVVDVVTMWYVIEHFPDLDPVLAKVGGMLESGGVFAFSTPNIMGISGRKNRAVFFRNSPEDHHSLWSPAAAVKILRRYGFRVEKIVITGHHPERFPFIGKYLRGLSLRFVFFLSRLFGLGDTFEVYSRKI